MRELAVAYSVVGRAEEVAWMQGLDRLNVGWSTHPVICAESWRGSLHTQQSLLQGVHPSSVPPGSLAGKSDAGLGGSQTFD